MKTALILTTAALLCLVALPAEADTYYICTAHQCDDHTQTTCEEFTTEDMEDLTCEQNIDSGEISSAGDCETNWNGFPGGADKSHDEFWFTCNGGAEYAVSFAPRAQAGEGTPSRSAKAYRRGVQVTGGGGFGTINCASPYACVTGVQGLCNGISVRPRN